MPFNIFGEFVPVDPSGCRYCGMPEDNHNGRWAPKPVGWHTYAPPTKEQRSERIRQNAADRRKAEE